MDMQAFLAKLKELKLKMAELENAEDELPGAEQHSAEAAESPELQKLEDHMGVEKHEAPAADEQDPAEEPMGDDDLMEAFGKKKKPVKPGMKVAIAIKAKPAKVKPGKFK